MMIALLAGALTGCSLIGLGPTPVTSNVLGGVAWTGSQLVVVGYCGVIRTSPDGRTWTRRDSGTGHNLLSVTWTGKLLVAVGASTFDDNHNVILTSPDGVKWTERDAKTKVALRSVVWAGDQLVALGSETMLTSPDGITWTPRLAGADAVPSFVAWTSKNFVGVGGAKVFVSKDAATWTSSGGGGNVAQPAATKVEHRTTQKTCRRPSYQECIPDRLGGTPTCITKQGADYDCSTTEDVVVATGAAGTAAVPEKTLGIATATWTGAQLVGVGASGAVATSPDGIIWTPRKSGTELALTAVVSANNQLLAVGQGYGSDTKNVITSPDGITWTAHDSGATYGLYGVAWTGKAFFAVSDGAVFTSPDGATWAPTSW